MSLDGEWEFRVTEGGAEALATAGHIRKINVPFCPESVLSGIGVTDYITECEYFKTFRLEEKQLENRTLLCVGACDYECAIYVNGRLAARHTGGYASFKTDISALVKTGENTLKISVTDKIAEDTASGKQTPNRESYGCFYTRVTGIWQSVWLEFVPERYIRNFKFEPDVSRGRVKIGVFTEGEADISIGVFYGGTEVGRASGRCSQYGRYEIALDEVRLWDIGKGELYDVELFFGGDRVKSYFGLRECRLENGKFYLNGRSVFQRLALDQGYHPDGLYTSPSREEMEREIGLAVALGFNGLRLHQKIFEPEFLYLCDKAGLMVWEEYPNWGLRYTDLTNLGRVLDEWREIIERDFNHPSIVMWCPSNEMWTDEFNVHETPVQCDIRYVKELYEFTKVLDDTRPVVDASGGYHSDATDLFDLHIYTDAEETEAYLRELEKGNISISNVFPAAPATLDTSYKGQPVMISEYGGKTIGGQGGWGYGKRIADTAEFVTYFCRLAKLHLDCPRLCGICYTQLYDVEQECNGLYYYDRTPKLSAAETAEIREVMTAPAAAEK